MRKLVLLFKTLFYLIVKPSRSYFSVVEEVYKTELNKRPNDPYLLWFLGNIYVRYKKYNEAEILLESLFNKGFVNKALILLLSKVYFNLRRYKDVEEILRRLEKIPDKEVANYYLGCSLIKLCQSIKGIEYIEKYLKYNSKDYMIYWKLGYEYYKEKKYEKALAAYRNAEKLNSTKKEIKEGIDACIREIQNINVNSIQ